MRAGLQFKKAREDLHCAQRRLSKREKQTKLMDQRSLRSKGPGTFTQHPFLVRKMDPVFRYPNTEKWDGLVRLTPNTQQKGRGPRRVGGGGDSWCAFAVWGYHRIQGYTKEAGTPSEAKRHHGLQVSGEEHRVDVGSWGVIKKGKQWLKTKSSLANVD